MSIDLEILENGHLAPRILKDFAEDPHNFDDDTVEEVWQHLDGCEKCIEAYEAICNNGEPPKVEEPSEPPAPTTVDNAADTRAFDPDELTGAKVVQAEDNGEHINGLMPVGDDPTRNGVPKEYANGNGRPTLKMESGGGDPAPAEDGRKEHPGDEASAPEEPGETESKEKGRREPTMEGLITGKVPPVKQPVDRLETESAAEAGERLANERKKPAEVTAVESDEEEETTEPDSDRQPAAKRERLSAAEAEPVSEETEPVADTAELLAEDGEPAADESDPGGNREPEAARATATAGSTEFEAHTPTAAAGSTEFEAHPPTAVTAPKTPTASAPAPAPKAGRPGRPSTAAKQEPLEEFFHKVFAFLAHPRNAIICGSVAAVAIAAVVFWILYSPGQKPSPVAGWEPLNVIETRVPLQEVLIRRMRNGRIPSARGTDVTLDFRGVDKLVIAVDLDFIKGNQSACDVIVRNPAGEIVFQEQIPQLYLDDGRFFLRLIPKLFELEQTYQLELVSYGADGSARVIAESVFDVLK